MRVYVPATLSEVADLLEAGSLTAPVRAYAVTGALRSWADQSGPCDEDELELVALSEAARAALRLIASSPDSTPRRVVIAADVPDLGVQVDDNSELRGPGQVTVIESVPLAWVRAAHVDEPDAEPDVRKGAQAVFAADAGDGAAEAVVAALDRCDLLWYDTQEFPDLIHPTH